MAGFSPDGTAVAQLLSVFELADSPSNEVQRSVMQQLDHFSSNVPDFAGYLAYIFIHAHADAREAVRLRAGLALKNVVVQRLAAIPGPVLEYIKETLWQGLSDSKAGVRATTASVLDWLIRSIGPSNWPEAVLRLMQFMEADNLPAREAAYKAIANICRQSPRVTADLEYNGQRLFDTVIPRLIQGLTSESVSIRASALEALNAYIVVQPPILSQHLQTFLQNMFNLTSDPSLRVRKTVVEAMNLLLKFWAEQIIPHIEPVIDFMLFCLSAKDEEEDLALVAAEFLLTFTEEPDLYEPLHIHLEKFLPGLLQAMTYTPTSRAVLDLDEDDSAKPDKLSDVKPHIHKSRTTGAAIQVPSLAARMGMTADDLHAANGNDEDEEDDAVDEDEDEDGEWTTRSAAATALASAAESFEGALLEILLPQVTQMLSQGDWYQREAAIFALGNVAIGCLEAMHDHLPSLVPFLLDSLRDQHPLIRSGAAWTLGEYSSWIASSGQETLVPTVQGLLSVSLDNNKHAQGNAITAFGYLAKEAAPSGALQAYLPSITQCFVAAFGKYQSRNIVKLYNALAHLSDGLGAGGLSDSAVLESLMPPIIERWQAFSDEEDDFRYLLECLTSVVIAAGSAFRPYAEPVFQRAYRIVHSSLFQYQQYASDPANFDKPEAAFMIVALDLISGLVQAMGADGESAFVPFVQSTSEQEQPMLIVCLSYPSNDVKQSTFALIGDIASNAVASLYPSLGQLLPILADSINPRPRASTSGMDSNCAWCIGELALALGSAMAAFVPPILERLLPVLGNIKASHNYTENAAICIGRLALASPQAVAQHFGDIIPVWAQTMIHATKGYELDTALQGICEAAKLNPQAARVNAKWLLEALKVQDRQSPALQAASAPITQALS